MEEAVATEVAESEIRDAFCGVMAWVNKKAGKLGGSDGAAASM